MYNECIRNDTTLMAVMTILASVCVQSSGLKRQVHTYKTICTCRLFTQHYLQVHVREYITFDDDYTHSIQHNTVFVRSLANSL